MSEVAEGGGKGVRVRSERASGVVATQKEAARKRSIYVGVVKHKKRWQARIDLHGKTHYLALMEDEAEAAARYDEAAVLHNKPVNFPQNKSQKQAVKRAASMTMREALVMEYRMVQRCMREQPKSDFYEGVRAVLVDKEPASAAWSPSTLEEVSDEAARGKARRARTRGLVIRRA